MSDSGPESKPAIDQLITEFQQELRAIAAEQLALEDPGHTLQPTAIVNEAYLRLAKQRNLDEASRTRFLAAAAVTMQRILIDYARAKRTEKRGGDRLKLSLDGLEVAVDDTQVELAAVSDVLETLAKENERIHQVVVLRYLGRLTVNEVALTLNISPRTVAEDWTFARAWLKNQLSLRHVL